MRVRIYPFLYPHVINSKTQVCIYKVYYTAVYQRGAFGTSKPTLGLIQSQKQNKSFGLLYIEGSPTDQILGQA